MYKFRKFTLDPKTLDAQMIGYYIEIIKLVSTHRHKLFDDFMDRPVPEHVCALVEQYAPHFWVVLTKADERFCGFVYLYDIIGDGQSIRTASVATCFAKPFWGKSARQAGRMFLNYCFNKMGICKIKAECFASNHTVSGFLRNLNFKKEGVLKNETLVRGKGEDLVLWGILNPKAR